MSAVLLTSIPKSGTNMLTQAIAFGSFGGKHTQIHAVLDEKIKHPMPVIVSELMFLDGFGRGHIIYDEAYERVISDRGIKTIFLYRDPRDMIVSHKHWVLRDEEDVGGGFINFEVSPGVRLRECCDIISELIKVYAWHIERFLPWMCMDGIFLLKYEDLLEKPEETYQKLIDWFPTDFRNNSGCLTPKDMMDRINPQTCSTFRKGIIGEWKEEFSKKHILQFWHEMYWIMEALGYEK